MPRRQGCQKLKLLYLLKILMEETDEEKSISMAEIISELEKYGISAERKSLYTDLEQLRLFGIDVIGVSLGKNYVYHIGKRQFELAELKLLVDSVQSAKFITEKKSNELISKLESLSSKNEAKKLQRQVFVTERVKSDNEQILYNIDEIHNAIYDDSQISFQYFNWNEKKKKELRHGGALYVLSPWALTLTDENYYLVAYDDKAEMIKYFRVDKMVNIKATGEERKGLESFEKLDIVSYTKMRFRMYDGKESKVKLLCKNSYAGVIIDRFGKDIPILKTDEEHFTVTIKVAVSRQFFAWVLSMWEGIKIIEPKEVVLDVKKYIEDLKKQYN